MLLIKSHVLQNYAGFTKIFGQSSCCIFRCFDLQNASEKHQLWNMRCLGVFHLNTMPNPNDHLSASSFDYWKENDDICCSVLITTLKHCLALTYREMLHSVPTRIGLGLYFRWHGSSVTRHKSNCLTFYFCYEHTSEDSILSTVLFQSVSIVTAWLHK